MFKIFIVFGVKILDISEGEIFYVYILFGCFISFVVDLD